ncbi:uncharacterized protein LOC117326356 [Pecten maximus]|uniref:uncharacterized protein LOC117326356 n=1 Tax=Pecten maximus TaxID=6579 RepID=UPI001458A9F7|nr:uncharacterized protein LOC117326356 [Pecten maximus]
MSGSKSRLDHGDAMWGVGLKGETETERRQYQGKQSYGDVLCPQSPRSDGDLRDQTKPTCTMGHFSTDLTQKGTHLAPAGVELTMDQSNDTVISVEDRVARSEHTKVPMLKCLVPHISVPTKVPTNRPSPGYTRPQCKPCAILVNGKWVNLNKRPCVLVRLGERMARVFRRLNRWYDEVMLDFVIIRARRQADKRREEGLRQQNV